MRVLLLIAAAAFSGCRHRPAAAPAAPRPSREQAGRALEAEHRRVAAQTKKLYEAGVDAYAKGDLGEARRLFNEVLALDPAYQPAEKALRRLAQRERQER